MHEDRMKIFDFILAYARKMKEQGNEQESMPG
jgi:hypothetical protein